MNCPNCNTAVKDGMRFCPKCGSEIPQTRICPDCGTEIKEGQEFCSKCGKHINIQTSNRTVSNPTSLNTTSADQETSVLEEFEQEIEQERRKSIIKWMCIIAAIFIGGYIFSEYNSTENSTSGSSTSSYSSSSDNDSYRTIESQPKTPKKGQRETCWYCKGAQQAVTPYGYAMCPKCHGTGFLVDEEAVW